MATYEFLSPEWIEAARELREAQAPSASPSAPGASLRMNLTVDGVPSAPDGVAAHVDTSTGVVDIELGHLADADVKVTLDVATARAVLVDNDAEAAMAAFLAGKVRVEGDMTKLLAFQSAPPSDAQLALASALREITA